ncbi:MAG: LptF/LptG family permease [Planctomycetaceae bacterium]|nr:LptF/LptG family permease [Planctomycetaceae bacterium]
MRLLQKYILLELLKVFGFVLSVLTILLVFIGVFREVSESGLGPFQAMKILPYVVPSLLPFTIPATLLLTVCVVYGRLAGDQEITAAKAAGINVLSLLWPSFMMGVVLSLCSLVLSDQAIPWAVANIQRTVTLAMEDIFLDMLRRDMQVRDQARGFSITVMGVDGKRLLMPTFQYTPPGKDTEVTVQAQEATLEFDLDNQQVILHLVRGHIDIPGSRRVWFEREDKPFPLPDRISQPKPRHMSIHKIRSNSEKLSRNVTTSSEQRDVETVLALTTGDFRHFTRGEYKQFDKDIHFLNDELHELHTEIHSRFALSTSCMFFVLIGGPFSILQARRQFLTSFFICFVPILLIYYPVVLLALNLGKSGTVDPSWAMWVGNVLLLVTGSWLLRKVLRH